MFGLSGSCDEMSHHHEETIAGEAPLLVRDPGVKPVPVHTRCASGLVEKVNHEAVLLRNGVRHRFRLSLDCHKPCVE